MKNSLNTRLLAAFGMMILMIALGAGVAGWFTWKAAADYRSLHLKTEGTAELAAAESGLWQLRYAISQATSADDAGVRKYADAEADIYKAIWKALDAYRQTNLGTEEARALTALRDVFQRYTEVRPPWFKLRLEGKADEAKEYRGKFTTPVGASLVKAFDEQIRLHTQASQDRIKELEAEASRVRVMVIAVSMLALAVAVALAAWIIRVLTGPVAHATAVARRIADGHLANQIAHDKGPMGDLLKALREMQSSLATTVSAVRANAENVATAGNEIAAGNSDLSARTEQQAAALQKTAASMEELSSTVHQNADNARQANGLAVNASEVAARGGEVVTQVVGTMRDINDSSKKIADIIGVIDSIAFQTNILALNAAVEAARAGEQGRGFAVVATEVRSLARRSADAAKEIKELIHSSVERVGHGTALVDRAGATMNEVVSAIRRVTEIVGEISEASAEQSRGMQQIDESVQQMDESTQQNAALVEESAAAAESLRTQAQQLVQAVAVFKLGNEGGGDARVVDIGQGQRVAAPSLKHRTVQPRLTASGR
ncbi:methyl-accepting chemotaxis protein [Noviherbaspirillum sp. ST9]|uniref:methyl-accepting chemotaxis protein n=1 Tax=Noviherbaspirillum sp. ST9 TaxID=3401606 RepID=UPI003B585CE7